MKLHLKYICVITLFHLICHAQCATTARKYCRKHGGLSRCVDSPLMVRDEDMWCPYHVCAPSYIAAPQCPPSGSLQATHKCVATRNNGPFYRCIEGTVHKLINLPLGCETTNRCTSEIRACACEQFEARRDVLTPSFAIKPVC